MGAIEALCAHVVGRGFDDLPEAAVAAAKMFVVDTFGVGISGSNGPKARELVQTQALWGNASDARVWCTGERLPAPAAAFCNAYQAHNSEFDCVHEAAVAHVMTIVLPVALAGAERLGSVSGKQLIEAVVLGVDVAASLGVAATSGLRFFRPATAGAFGGVAALGKIMKLDASQLHNAFSIVYGQLCGTMQAHTEGSMLLAMQMGFNARNAVVACDLARAGIEGPKDILEGPFGYFKLIEASGTPDRIVADLGRVWRITEVAHKPFPSGRATHGVIDACLELKRQQGFVASGIKRVTAHVPPLVHHLVGRPPKSSMTINYARLCASYVAACALRRDTVSIEDFQDSAYGDAETQALAQRIEIVVRDAGDPNALTPIAVEVELENGQRHAISLDVVYGNPKRPMSRAAHLDKFRRNCSLGARPLPPAQIERVIALADDLAAVGDVRVLADHLVA